MPFAAVAAGAAAAGETKDWDSKHSKRLCREHDVVL
jgi:hypothetical protein